MENIKMINKIRIKRKEKQLLLRLVTGILIFSILLNVGIAALYPQVVYASFAGTVAGYILTLFASFNCAITNPNVVGAINNTFGNMALEAADAGVIDQGIQQIAVSTGFDMSSIFSNTAAEAAQFAQAAGVEIESVAYTAGQNISAGAAACAATAGAVLPAIAGTVLPAAAAVGLGVAGGFVIDHIRSAITNYVKSASKLDTPSNVMSYASTYPNIAYFGENHDYVFCSQDGIIPIGWQSEYANWWNVGYGCYTTNPTIFAVGKMPNEVYQHGPINSIRVDWTNQAKKQYAVGFTTFDTKDQALSYIQSIANGSIPNPQNNKYSPDIVGNIGNQRGVKDGQSFNLPYINPIYNYGDTIIQYINPTDYQTLVDDANNNTDIGDTGEDTQGETFKDFIEPYVQPAQDETQDPVIPNPQPTIAPTNPTIPVQPTPAPEPTLTPEEETEMPKGMVQPSLKDKFPFCIPFDIGYLFSKLTEEREAPYFLWTLDLGAWGQYEIEIDLSMFDSVAAIFRLCELILFILGLMLITKSLMSSNDGG